MTRAVLIAHHRSVRIIGGEARGRLLKAPKSKARPTADRVREAIFSIIGARRELRDVVVLDLFAGSGALGLEALSRGAARAVFVDRDAGCARVIADNARRLGYEQRALVLRLAVHTALERLGRRGERFALIFADPPYALDPAATLARLAAGNLLEDDGLVVLEHSRRREAAAADRLELCATRVYGDSAVAVYGPIEAAGKESSG